MRYALLLAAACAPPPRPFVLRDPFVLDTDLHPVSVPCRADPEGPTCAPAVYDSPFVWDHIDNLVFARLSRLLAVRVSGEAANVNSLDEVPDSAWFTNGGGLGAWCDQRVPRDPDGTAGPEQRGPHRHRSLQQILRPPRQPRRC